MNLENRIGKLEQRANVESAFCVCPVVVRVIGVDGADFNAKHPPCGKPIDEAAIGDATQYDLRLYKPISEDSSIEYLFEQYQQRTSPAAEGLRIYANDFSSQKADGIVDYLKSIFESEEVKAAINPAGGFDLRRLTNDELLGIEAALSRTVSGEIADANLSPELEAAMARVKVTL
jgi:hypothetical protein